VHRAIDPVLDEFDPIEDAYYLDVSSPGLERDIRTPEHYNACIGEKIEVKLFAAHEGMKSFVGRLIGYAPESDSVTVEIGTGREVTVTRKQISKCNMYFDFDNDSITEGTKKDHE
jgi:ribosome maturation factor RimP